MISATNGTVLARPAVACEEVACPTTRAALRDVADRLRAEVGGVSGDGDWRPRRATRTRFLADTDQDPTVITVRVFLR